MDSQEENDSLRCQLEAYKNEVETVRSDLKLELQAKEQQVKILEEGIKSMKEKTPATSLTVQSQPLTDTDNPVSEIHIDDRTAKLLSK